MFSAIARVFRTPTFVGRSHSLWRSSPCTGSALTCRPRSSTSRTCSPAFSSPPARRGCCRWSTCSRAARCCSCRSSRSASCRTSPRRSSCSCCASSSRTSRPSTKRASRARRKLTQYTRYLTIALALLQSTTLVTVARSGQLFGHERRSRVPAAADERRVVGTAAHDHHDDRRHRPHHVVRRARHRARHRQRHVAS